MSQTLHFVKKLDYLCNCKSEISNVCIAVEGHCLHAMKIVHHYANSCFDWLISEQQSGNPLIEAISILSGKHKRFTFVHPVGDRPFILLDKQFFPSETDKRCYLFMNIV